MEFKKSPAPAAKVPHAAKEPHKIPPHGAAKFLLRNESKQTIFAEVLNARDDLVAKSYLKEGCANSIFVKGYGPNSVVCTLPQARQPPSSVVIHPDPLLGTSPEVMQDIDEALAAHIDNLARESAAKQIKDELGPNDVAVPTLPISHSVFNPLPPVLKIGDRVRR